MTNFFSVLKCPCPRMLHAGERGGDSPSMQGGGRRVIHPCRDWVGHPCREGEGSSSFMQGDGDGSPSVRQGGGDSLSVQGGGRGVAWGWG